MAISPFGACRVVPAALVVASLSLVSLAAPVAAQQPDPTVLANPQHRQTLKVDPSTWQTRAMLSQCGSRTNGR